jgi:hypothetical protein
MTLFALIYFLPVVTILAQQSQSTGAATTKGSCSPAVTGSGDTIKINVKDCGMSREQTQEWRASFKQILEKQIDPKVLTALLDDIKSGIIRIENGVLRIEQGMADRHLTPEQKERLINRLSNFPKPRVILLIKNGNSEVDGFLKDFQYVFSKLDWPVEGPIYDLVPSGARGLGVVVKSQSEHPLSAVVLIQSLRDMNFTLEAGADDKLATDQMRFVIASK